MGFNNRLIGPPSTYFLSSLLKKGAIPIYKKLYENNMNGKDSFYKHSDGIDYLIKESKVAFLENGDQIRFANKFPCDLQSIWKSPSALYTYSMYMERNSSLTLFETGGGKVAPDATNLSAISVPNVLGSPKFMTLFHSMSDLS